MGLASAAPLRPAVLGGGAVVSEFHLPGAALCPRVALAAVADPSAASRARLREVGYAGELLDCGYSEALALTEAGCRRIAAASGRPPGSDPSRASASE